MQYHYAAICKKCKVGHDLFVHVSCPDEGRTCIRTYVGPEDESAGQFLLEHMHCEDLCIVHTDSKLMDEYEYVLGTPKLINTV